MSALGFLFGGRAAERGTTPPPAATLPENGIRVHRSGGDAAVVFDRLVLERPGGGGPLLDYGSVALRPGDRMMLTGPAGCGKSSGLCALKEAWVHGGSGALTLPPDETVRFVPQEDYFPDLTLRGILCAPHDADAFSDARVRAALEDADLGDFAADLDDESRRGEHWKAALSGGQKKKVAIAAAFLHAPYTKLLILDEVTSALDPDAERSLYKKLLDRMRHGIVISIVHRLEIAPLHNVVASVADGKVSYVRRDAATGAVQRRHFGVA